MIVKINGGTYPLIESTGRTEMLMGFSRDVITMTVRMPYAQAAEDFVDGAVFSIVDGEDKAEYAYTDYGVAGPITDNRDGTVTAKMGKDNTTEQDAQAAAAAIAGKPVTLAEAKTMRVTIEYAVHSLTDEEAAVSPPLSTPWVVGEAVAAGDRRYYAPRLYKAVQAHTTQADWTPPATPALWAAVDVSHAGTMEDPIPAARGMEYEYGKYYADPEDGKTYLRQRTGEPAGGKITLQYLPHELIGSYFTAS